MTDSQKQLEELKKLLDKADYHFAKGSEIWNSIGLDSPQLATKAAQAALAEYRKSADLLEPSRFLAFSSEIQNHISASRELALAHAASAESFLYDQWNDAGIKKIVELIQREIDHTKRAIRYLELSGSDEAASLASWRIHLRHSQGRQATLLARLAGREGRLIEARDLYKLAEEKFKQVMESYETEIPELASIEPETKETLERKREKIKQLGERVEASGICLTSMVLRTPEQPSSLPKEDLYRRAASNYYASASARSNLDAFEILNNRGSPHDADKKLEESIQLIYLAMEIFPGNLEFHQGLFNTWRARGELFGCLMEETEEYYHTQCPLAIMHYIGGWYVSPTLEYETLTCAVCDKDILECPHYPGQVVGNKVVRYEPQGANLTSVSVVDVPEDPCCRIEWISIPKRYFPPPPENNPVLRCLFCQAEKDQGKVNARLMDLPDWFEEKLENRYKQIARSKGYWIIDLD